MIKNILIRKIIVSTSLLLIIVMLSIIPTNNISISKTLKYNTGTKTSLYLLNESNYLTRTETITESLSPVSTSKDLIELLTINNKKKEIIPNGFKSILPENTKIKDIKLDNGILYLNFSKELLNIEKEKEEHLIESLIYTLTSINGIDKISISVDNKKLKNLPNSNKPLPEYLDKTYGINKEYTLSSLNNIDSYTIYYVLNYNNETYYTPVTKYINNENQDKIKIIIDELASNITYESNLNSYLDHNTKLLDYEIIDKTIKLNFNNYILSSITDNLILEEVIYTIGLSLCDDLSLEKVIFMVENQEISTFSSKPLDK